MDREPDLEARRLYLSAALTMQVSRRTGGRIAANGDAGTLLSLARDLGAQTERIERVHRLSFDPNYPGVTAGVEAVRGGLRLLLACRVSDRDGTPLGAVFTSLIPGRSPQVSVAPVEAEVPGEWRPLGDLP